MSALPKEGQWSPSSPTAGRCVEKTDGHQPHPQKEKSAAEEDGWAVVAASSRHLPAAELPASCMLSEWGTTAPAIAGIYKHGLFFIWSWFWIQRRNRWIPMNANEKTLKKALSNAHLAAEIPWSRRWFSQDDPYQSNSSYAKSCNFPKHQTSDCVICGTGGLGSCFSFLQWFPKGKSHHLTL